MAIEPNERPSASPEDKATLKAVYQRQLEEDRLEHVRAAKRLDQAVRAYEVAREEYQQATAEEARITGKMDALRLLAARDGVTLE